MILLSSGKMYKLVYSFKSNDVHISHHFFLKHGFCQFENLNFKVFKVFKVFVFLVRLVLISYLMLLKQGEMLWLTSETDSWLVEGMHRQNFKTVAPRHGPNNQCDCIWMLQLLTQWPEMYDNILFLTHFISQVIRTWTVLKFTLCFFDLTLEFMRTGIETHWKEHFVRTADSRRTHARTPISWTGSIFKQIKSNPDL